MSGDVRRVMDVGAAAAGMMAQPPPPPPPPDLDSGYPDSVGSSPRSSRDNDADFNRWDAAAGGGAGAGDGNRVRLMCSFGGRIMPRPHDNQLTYAGGETRILAVDRNIRYNVIMARLAALTGVPVSFKYQLPTEDLDALVSVTNDEDLDNMMAEYDRLCKHGGFRFSRLRLFLFRADAGASSDETGKKDGWFVDALNAGVSRSESGGGAGSENSAWSNNIPDYLFGLEGKSAADEADLAGNEGGSVRSSSSRISEPDVPERRRREPEEPVAPPPQSHAHAHQHPHAHAHAHQLQHQQQQHQQQQPQAVPVPVQEFQRLQIRHQQQQQQPPQQAPPPQQVPQPVKVMNPEPVYSAASSAPTVADYGNVPEPPAPAPVAPQQQFVTPPQPVTYWDPHTHQQVYVVHAPVPTPVQQRTPQPAVAPVPTPVAAPYYVARTPAVNVYGERPAPVVQRQPAAPTSAELTEAYREPPPPAAKVPAPVYAQGPVPGGVIYRPVPPAHGEGGQYVYHHGGVVYEAAAAGVGGAPRPVFYTQSGTPVMSNVGVAATAVPVTYSSPPSDMGPSRATQPS